MKSLWVDQKVKYDGSQLRRLYAYETYSLMGDSIISWCGECDVSNEHMKDGEDLFQGEKIYSENMLHFLIESHDVSLEAMIAYQRLFSSILKDRLEDFVPDMVWKRSGDDLFHEDKKLNISIATGGALSSMIHCGVNISSKNTPVKTIGLEDMEIPVRDFALDILSNWVNEYESIKAAKTKVFSI